MQAAGIKARHEQRRQPGQMLAVVHSIVPNLLDRQFKATGPNRKWAADFAYAWTAEEWLFVAVVLDLYSRRVVGWSMQPTMTAQLVIEALLIAISRRGRPEAVLQHSDLGSQSKFNRPSRHDIADQILDTRPAFWSASSCQAFCEALKTERLSRKQFRIRDGLRADVFN